MPYLEGESLEELSEPQIVSFGMALARLHLIDAVGLEKDEQQFRRIACAHP